MHVIYLHPHFISAGGAGRMVLETGRRLAERGHSIHCICLRADDAIVGSFRDSIAFHEVDGPLTSKLSYWLNYRKYERRMVDSAKSIACGRYETILFPQVFPANWWGEAVLRSVPDLPCLWYCHEPSAFIHRRDWIDALPWPKNWIARLLSPVLKRTDLRRMKAFSHVVTNSDQTRRDVIDVYHYPEQMCETVYLGVDHERFSQPHGSERSHQICTVAKLTKFKNVDRLIFALCALKRRGDLEVRLRIVGDGDAKADLQKLASRLNVSDQVEFLGRLDDDELVDELRRSKVFSIVSDNEPFGLVMIEALACGTPVVAMDSGGPREVLSGWNCGELVTDPNPEKLADALQRFLGCNECQEISEAARQCASRFSWDETINQLEARMTSVIAQHRPPMNPCP